MLKQILTSAVVTTAFISGVALAGGPDMPQAPECMHCFKPFVGVYYSYLNVNTQNVTDVQPFQVAGALTGFGFTGSIPSSFSGLGFMWGGKYGPYFGVATGMNHYFESSKTVTAQNLSTLVTTSASLNSTLDLFYADARGYLPLMESFDLIGSVGAALIEGHTNLSGTLSDGVSFSTDSFSDNVLSWRFGVGFDYYFTSNWGVEAMFHYMPTSGTKTFLNDFWTIDAGINYMFS